MQSRDYATYAISDKMAPLLRGMAAGFNLRRMKSQDI